MGKPLIAFLLVALAAVPAHAAEPDNDDPANAAVVSSFPATIEVDTAGATMGPFEEECFGLVSSVPRPAEAIWYHLDLPGDVDRIRILHESFDSSVVLWDRIATTPSGDPILDRIGCIYPGDYYSRYVEGYELYLSVGSPLNRDVSPFSISIESLGQNGVPILNDVPYRATKIEALPYETEQRTFDARYDSDPQGCEQGAYVWYTYTPASSETIEISVSSRYSFDGASVAAYAISEDVRTLGCDDTYDEEAAVVATPVEGSVPVLIGIGRQGILALSVRKIADPEPAIPPDDRQDAVALSFGSTVPFSTSGASLEAGEPLSCGSGGSIWFTLPLRPRGAEVVVTGAVSIASVDGHDVLDCSSDGAISIPANSPATHLQVRAPDVVEGTIGLRFAPAYGKQLTDASPFPADCGDQTDGPYHNSEVEVSQVVDPHDPDHILASWQQDRHSDRGGAHGIGAAVTFDGGETWTNSTIPGVSLCSGGSYQRATDPWGAIDADGTAYVMSLALNPGPNDFINFGNAILMNRSEDGGRTWGDPITVAASPAVLLNDKEALTADPNTPGLLYAVWNAGYPAFARSEDGGRTWTPPIPMQHGGTGNQIAVLDDGTLVKVAGGSMSSVSSRDRGTTWSSETEFGPGGGAEGPPDVRGGAYIPSVATDGQAVFVSWSDTYVTYFARSDDAGASWDVTQVGGQRSNYPSRFTTAVAATASGRLAVMTYVLDLNFDAWLVLGTSTDGGATWSEQTITEKFDMERAPHSAGRGYFLGDYFGIAGVGNDVIAAITAVPSGDASGVSNVYSLRITP